MLDSAADLASLPCSPSLCPSQPATESLPCLSSGLCHLGNRLGCESFSNIIFLKSSSMVFFKLYFKSKEPVRLWSYEKQSALMSTLDLFRLPMASRWSRRSLLPKATSWRPFPDNSLCPISPASPLSCSAMRGVSAPPEKPALLWPKPPSVAPKCSLSPLPGAQLQVLLLGCLLRTGQAGFMLSRVTQVRLLHGFHRDMAVQSLSQHLTQVRDKAKSTQTGQTAAQGCWLRAGDSHSGGIYQQTGTQE